MIKLIFTAILAFVCCFTFAQCKVSKDAFTNKSIISGTVFLTPVSPVYSNVITLTKDDDDTKITYTLITPSINRDIKIENCALLLKLTDETVIKFIPDKTSKITILEGISPSLVISISSLISQDQLALLNINLIQSVRLGYSETDGFTIPFIKASKFHDVQKTVACVLK